MSKDLRTMYKVGQNVIYVNDDFDAIRKDVLCVVQEVHENKMTILDIETDTKLYIEDGFNLDCVKLQAQSKFDSAINKLRGL